MNRRVDGKVGQYSGHRDTITKTSYETSSSSWMEFSNSCFLCCCFPGFRLLLRSLSSLRFAESCSFWRLVWKFSRFLVRGLVVKVSGCLQVWVNQGRGGRGGCEWLANSGPYLALCFTFQLQTSYLCASDGSCQRNQDCKTEENVLILIYDGKRMQNYYIIVS